MKPTVKKIVIGSAILIGALAFIGWRKVEKLKRIFEQLQIKPTSVRSLKISLTDIRFDVDILFSNPTNEVFDISGYVASLVRLNFFYSNNYIGTAKPVVTEITIPAQNQLLFKNIPVVLPTSAILNNLMALTAFDVNKLEVEAVIQIAGKEYFIR